MVTAARYLSPGFLPSAHKEHSGECECTVARLGTRPGLSLAADKLRHFDIRRIRVKVIADGDRVLRVKAEFGELSSICVALREPGRTPAIM